MIRILSIYIERGIKIEKKPYMLKISYYFEIKSYNKLLQVTKLWSAKVTKVWSKL